MTRAMAVGFLTFTLTGAAGLSVGGETPAASPARITYVANEGFLVAAGGSAVLVDATRRADGRHGARTQAR